MGIRKKFANESAVCPICGLEISEGEYVLMKWRETDMMSYEKRKEYCAQYHPRLRNMQVTGEYDYRMVFKSYRISSFK